MKMDWPLALFFLQIFWHGTCLATFVNQPSSFNASLGQAVQFNCSISQSAILYWLINDAELHDTININRQVSTRREGGTTWLNIEALMINDDIKITCVAETGNGERMLTNPATLRVQGILDAPTHLSAYSVKNSIHLMWSAPSSLNLTNTEPDILHYIVSVHNTHTGGNASMIVNTTEYIQSPGREEWDLSDSFCKEIEFRVSAVNVVGLGSESEVIHAAYHGAPVVAPSRVPTASGESTTFSCTAQCSDGIIWNIIDPIFHQQLLQQRVLLRPLDSHHHCHSGIDGGMFTEHFEVPATPELNGTMIQCIAIQLCEVENDICRPVICSSNQDTITFSSQTLDVHTTDVGPISTTTRTEAGTMLKIKTGTLPGTTELLDDADFLTYTIGGAVGGVCLLLLLLTVVALVVIIVAHCKGKTSSRQSSLTNISGNGSFDGIYDLPKLTKSNSCCKSLDDLNSTYSIPLPTDPCPAYNIVEQKNK